MQEETLVLRVAEARPQDVGRRIARIARQNMLKLNLRPGDFISITGQRSTVARVWPLPDEEDSDIIRIDGIIRHNAGTTIGDAVKIKAIELNSATKLILAPIEKISFGPDFTDYVKSLLKDMPVTKGDTILIPILGEALKLVVSSVQPSPSAYVTHDTEIIIKEEPVKEIEAVVSKVTYEDIGDLEDAKIKIREMIELPMKHPELFKHLGIEPPKGILLYGPPGCGKTLLAKAVATESGANFFSINGPEIMSKFYGESESRLREIFEEAEKAAPSVIFIDEIDSIAPKREEVTGEVERRVVAQLLTLMDGLKSRGQVVVIAATNRPEAVDPALRRPGRFDREIAIPMPDKKARKEILQVHLRNMPLADDVNIDELAELTHGYSGADIAALAREAAIRALRRFLPKIDLEKKTIPANILKDLKVSRNDFFEAMKDITPSTLREVYVEVPEIHWNDIGGLEDVKKQLREMVELPMKNPELFEKMGITPPKGILLYGPPGCGKTLLAKAVATESGANFISVRGPEILSKWVGESEKAIREIFKKARQAAPCVIFFDEIDSIAPVRGGRFDSGVTERIVNQLLAEMDGLIPLRGVVVIAATNRPDIVDPALLRPGRFDRLVFIPLPDKKAREEIFKVHTRKMPLAEDVNISVLADMTEGYTGADIEAICREAALNAIREDLKPKKVEMKHFIEAIKNTPKSLSPEDVKRYETMKNMLRFYQ
ncbi:MAG: AAA family ATPase [Candidatus Methanomethylicota archaeon]|jgi:transitional endoplasmic reticulum ATPase|uniref:AAA family ATPase n=1 Tax=Thermoproteota archaeon TaxID=2056631 RepID=A0A520KGZ3_9CREN|nr:MAG: AAA family ATPase [Candidatus Verstraetearchaeota archaeon]TDA37951.1 MAG: AAA family ATPase [Candidatus Verstraetearchaeota archaeon]